MTLRKFGYATFFFASLAVPFQWVIWFRQLSNVSNVQTAGALTNPALVEFSNRDFFVGRIIGGSRGFVGG